MMTVIVTVMDVMMTVKVMVMATVGEGDSDRNDEDDGGDAHGDDG